MSSKVAEYGGGSECVDEVGCSCLKSITVPFFFFFLLNDTEIFKSLVDFICNCVFVFLQVTYVNFTGYDASPAKEITVGIIATG